jgi:hypothetical protein
VLTPILNFISQFSMQSNHNCQITVDVSFLHMILRIYVVIPTLSDSTQEDDDAILALRDACRSSLEVLARSQNQEVVLNHPVCILWIDVRSQPPEYALEAQIDPVRERCAAWRGVEQSCVRRRALMIYKYSLWRTDADGDTAAALAACVDMVEFTR